MSIQSEITRLTQSKEELRTFLTDNGVAVAADATMDEMVPLLNDVIAKYLPLTGGTMTGTLVAANPAVGTQAVRNIYAGTTDLTAGSSSLATGVIYIVYE